VELAHHYMNHQLIVHQLVDLVEELILLLLLLTSTMMVSCLKQNFAMLDFKKILLLIALV
jgi:hypothetical protein